MKNKQEDNINFFERAARISRATDDFGDFDKKYTEEVKERMKQKGAKIVICMKRKSRHFKDNKKGKCIICKEVVYFRPMFKRGFKKICNGCLFEMYRLAKRVLELKGMN